MRVNTALQAMQMHNSSKEREFLLGLAPGSGGMTSPDLSLCGVSRHPAQMTLGEISRCGPFGQISEPAARSVGSGDGDGGNPGGGCVRQPPPGFGGCSQIAGSRRAPSPVAAEGFGPSNASGNAFVPLSPPRSFIPRSFGGSP